MSKFFQQASSSEPVAINLKRWLWAAGGILLIASLGFWWWLDQKATKIAAFEFSKAQDAILSEQWDLALRYLNKVNQHKPLTEAYLIKYRILNGQTKYHEAMDALKEALALSPKDAYLNWLASVQFQQYLGDIEKAMPYAKKACRIEKSNVDYCLDYGAILASLGNTEGALTQLRAVQAFDPKNSQVWDHLASVYFEQEDYEKVIAIRREAVEALPDSAYQWYSLGLSYTVVERFREAVNAFQISIDLDSASGASAAEWIATITDKPVDPAYREVVEDMVPSVTNGAQTIVYVDVDNDATPAKFLLDTGAEITVINKAYLDKRGIKLKDDMPTIAFMGMAGIPVHSPIMYIDLKIGRFEMKNTPAAVITNKELPFDGILGMNLLSKFNIKMNNETGQLIFSPIKISY